MLLSHFLLGPHDRLFVPFECQAFGLGHVTTERVETPFHKTAPNKLLTWCRQKSKDDVYRDCHTKISDNAPPEGLPTWAMRLDFFLSCSTLLSLRLVKWRHALKSGFVPNTVHVAQMASLPSPIRSLSMY